MRCGVTDVIGIVCVACAVSRWVAGELLMGVLAAMRGMTYGVERNK